MDTTFTPIASFNGGILVGLGAVLLMAGLGRIYGATGILSGLFFPGDRQEFTWRMALVAGMVLSPLLMLSVTGSMPEITVPVNPFMITAGGLIVGIGASLGSGCTSGHGVCGLSRFSIRSMIAVPTFMVTAAITVFIIRHVAGV
jgi:uncharacterized membrane protein YedE/YeeE